MGTTLLVIVAIVAVGVLLMITAFIAWRSSKCRYLLSASSVIDTACGPVDCAFVGPSDGPPVLVLHGGLGGWDQAIALAEDLDFMQAFRVIGPSRPGYLRTPLAVGSTAEEAASAMVALLDAMKIGRAAVVGISGGGPTALALAIQHPDRIRALAMVCAISNRHDQPDITAESLLGRILFSNVMGWLLDLVSWMAQLLVQVAPTFMTMRVLRMTELGSRAGIRKRVNQLRAHPQRLQWVRRLLDISCPISPRRQGLRNDLVTFASLPEAIAGRITCPTFVVHGKIDGNVPVSHAEVTCRAANNVERLIIEDASHLLWLHPRIDEIKARLLAFLRAN